MGDKPNNKYCKKCKRKVTGESIGNYNFNYLNETVKLCGHCANKVMMFIKED